LARRPSASVEELQASILAAVEHFTRGARQADDLTLLLIRYHGAAQAAKALASST
jgi:serine phosphatase RsbU (regulator of sigma subunit)